MPPLPPVKDGDEEAKIRYEVMNTIPENWIPFIRAHVKDSNREVQIPRSGVRVKQSYQRTRWLV